MPCPKLLCNSTRKTVHCCCPCLLLNFSQVLKFQTNARRSKASTVQYNKWCTGDFEQVSAHLLSARSSGYHADPPARDVDCRPQSSPEEPARTQRRHAVKWFAKRFTCDRFHSHTLACEVYDIAAWRFDNEVM